MSRTFMINVDTEKVVPLANSGESHSGSCTCHRPWPRSHRSPGV